MSNKKTSSSVIAIEANNRIWQTYKHFPYKAWNAIAELVDNSSQNYLDNKAKLDKVLAEEGERFAVRVDFDRDEMISIVDNAMGMDLADLQRALQLAAPPPNTDGRSEFGMGLKTSCCWLGDKWTIVTKKLGSEIEYTTTVDVNKLARASDHNVPVKEKAADAQGHYTRIEIRGLHSRLKTRAKGKAKTVLVQMFRQDIESSTMELFWDGEALKPPEIKALVTTNGGKETEWKKKVDFVVGPDKLKVTGWVCILGDGFRGREKAGFDLLRRGRMVVGRPGGYRGSEILGENRNDSANQRVYGELHLDNFPVNHLKDDFLWDGLEDAFQDGLKTAITDYVRKANNLKLGKTDEPSPVPTEVKTATNEEVAEELTEQAMVEQIAVVEVMEVGPPVDPAVRAAKAESLRDQKIEPREIEVGGKKVRIFHPEDMPDSDAYFICESSADNAIDIFINDNHPFVQGKANQGEADYKMFVRLAVMDAIVEHNLIHHKKFDPGFPGRLKDQLLRGLRI